MQHVNGLSLFTCLQRVQVHCQASDCEWRPICRGRSNCALHDGDKLLRCHGRAGYLNDYVVSSITSHGGLVPEVKDTGTYHRGS